MRFLLIFAVCLPGAVFAEELSLPSFSDMTDMFDPVVGLEPVEVKPERPKYIGECLVGEDGFSPLMCVGSDKFRAMPEGFSWRNDPQDGRPRHCLFWEEGDEFVGHPKPALCRDGEVEKEKPGVLMTF